MKTMSQIIRVLREEESVVQLISHDVEDGRQRACPHFAYYFLMPKTHIKRSRKGNHPGTLYAFGPFRSANQARFISTSAHALGLVDEPGAQSAEEAHQARPPMAGSRNDDNTGSHSECLSTRPLAPPVVQLVRHSSDTSHAA